MKRNRHRWLMAGSGSSDGRLRVQEIQTTFLHKHHCIRLRTAVQIRFLHARVRLTCEYQFAQTQQSHVNPLL